ncbi:MAG: GNAT family N-acetyltransferase [Caldilineae bacterium]|nr:MAG: GNAT family N-acetyltransferase [Caldilineae bacterium]
MQITLHTAPTAFDVLAEEWQDLMGRAVNAPIFMTVDYQRIWWQHLGRGDLHLLACRTGDGRLVGLAPLFVDGTELHFVGCVDVSDYLDFLVDGDYASDVYAALVDYLAGPLSDRWQTAYFCSLAHHSPTPATLVELARARGWAARAEVEEVCPVITLPATWDDYLAALNKKQRHEIRRKLRKAEAAADTRWYVIEDPAALTGEAIETFIALHRQSAAEKDEFWDEAMLAFFRALVRRMAERGWLKLYFVEMNGQPASALLCFDYRNEILVYNSGFNVGEFAHLSPGNIIVSYSIQHAIELGRARYDFLRGDEVYKFRFGAVAEEVFGVKIARNG